MFCQIAIICCAVSAALSAPTDVVPLEKQQPTVIPIISQSEELELNGTYRFSYETGNGIKREEISFDKVIPKGQGRSVSSSEGGGSEESDEIHVQQGSYSYTAPDGTIITVRYIADENGFQAFGDHLPRAPIPVQITYKSSDKRSRALKSGFNSETASEPIPAVNSETESKPLDLSPETAKSAPNAQPEPFKLASAPAVVTDSITKTAEKSKATDEQSTAAGEQSTAAGEESTVAAKQSIAAAEQSTAAVAQSTDSTKQSTDVAEKLTTIVENAAARESSSVVTEKSSIATIDKSVPTANIDEPVGVAADQPTVSVEKSAIAATSEGPATNSGIEEQSSSITDDKVTTVSSDSQPPVTATV